MERSGASLSSARSVFSPLPIVHQNLPPVRSGLSIYLPIYLPLAHSLSVSLFVWPTFLKGKQWVQRGALCVVWRARGQMAAVACWSSIMIRRVFVGLASVLFRSVVVVVLLFSSLPLSDTECEGEKIAAPRLGTWLGTVPNVPRSQRISPFSLPRPE